MRAALQPAAHKRRLPRLGFLGVGWIGRDRLRRVAEAGAAEVAAVADPSEGNEAAALDLAPGAAAAEDLDTLLDMGLDGLVIATPSALHAPQAIRALEAGCAVFCQKPLGCSASETMAVVDAARRAGRPLGVDMSYRGSAALRAVREAIAAGEAGTVYAADLVFHNAYGPDKGWSRNRHLSGGGCVIDLGVHLVDALLWCLDRPKLASAAASLFAGGRPLQAGAVEDHARATLEFAGVSVQLACSWGMNLGRDAEVAIRFHGDRATIAFENVEGSFFDFRALRHEGARSVCLVDASGDPWGGRMILDWVAALADGAGFDPAAWEHVETAGVIDRIYGRSALLAAV